MYAHVQGRALGPEPELQKIITVLGRGHASQAQAFSKELYMWGSGTRRYEVFTKARSVHIEEFQCARDPGRD